MSLYGNIKKVSNNTFLFDRIYHTRVEMELNTKTDGVYAGRYVLINYGLDIFRSYLYIPIQATDTYNSQFNYYYKNENNVYILIDSITQEDFNNRKTENNLYRAGYYVGLRYKDIATPNGGGITGEGSNGEPSETPILDSTLIINELYKLNKDTDQAAFGNTYDSTVWQKIYAGTLGEKYIMIAELNALAPLLELVNISPLKYHEYNNAEGHSLKSNVLIVLTVTEDGETFTTPVNVDNVCEDYIKPYFNITDSNELSYFLYLPTPLELKVDEGFNYNKEGFDISYSEPLDSLDKLNYICWTPDGLLTKVENGQIVPDGESLVNSKTLHFNIPSFGNVMKDLYDLLYGLADEDDDSHVRPYFKPWHTEAGDYNNLPRTYSNDDREWLENVPGIGELLANNSEGLASILANLFTMRDPLSGTVKYYLLTSWASYFDPDSNQSFIEDKPKVIGYHYNEAAEPQDFTYISNCHYSIDYDSWTILTLLSLFKTISLYYNANSENNDEKNNLTKVTLELKFNTIIIHFRGNIENDLRSYSINEDERRGTTAKWIGLLIESELADTNNIRVLIDGTSNIININNNDIQTTTIPTTVNNNGETQTTTTISNKFIYWFDINRILNQDINLIFSKTNYSKEILTIKFKQDEAS